MLSGGILDQYLIMECRIRETLYHRLQNLLRKPRKAPECPWRGFQICVALICWNAWSGWKSIHQVFLYQSAKELHFVSALAISGVDVILDFVGAPYWEKNLASIALDGRIVLLGLVWRNKILLFFKFDIALVCNKIMKLVGWFLDEMATSLLKY